MLKVIVQKELQSYIFSLRFFVMLLIALFLFGAGTVSSLNDFQRNRGEHLRLEQERRERLEELSGNATRLAIARQSVVLPPRANTFITDAHETALPIRFEYSAYNVWDFSMPVNEVNPLIRPFKELTWGLIVSLAISFAVFLFTFDAVSGEKESRTLAASLSNSISRGTVLFAKFIAATLSVMCVLIPGMVLGVTIILLLGTVPVTGALVAEIGAFTLACLVFTACLVVFGLWSSVMVHQSRISMVIALSIWIVFIIIVPYSIMFWSQTIFTIDSGSVVQAEINTMRENINESYPVAARMSSSEMPFMPEHELHSERVMELLAGEKAIRNEHYRQMFRQYENIRVIGYFSPVSLFAQINEAVVVGGYYRFRNAWSAMAGYQERFFDFFTEIDRADPESPHWYNPEQDLSTTRRSIDPQSVPVFTEPQTSFAERISYASVPAVILLLVTIVMFFTVYVMFVRYDVR